MAENFVQRNVLNLTNYRTYISVDRSHVLDKLILLKHFMKLANGSVIKTVLNNINGKVSTSEVEPTLVYDN